MSTEDTSTKDTKSLTVPYFRPEIGAEEREAVERVLASGWLTTGKVTRQFEAEFAAYTGASHAVAMSSCTAALHCALEAIGVRGPESGVVVPALTFAATAAVVRYLGARPILADCEPETLCIDPGAAEQTIGEWAGRLQLRALMPVHYGGQMADMDRLAPLARQFGLKVIEDAAHCLPAYTASAGGGWEPVGARSTATCFSFYANKCITTGEGGMLITNDEELAARVRMMSLHGLSKSAWNRFSAKGSWHYEIEEPGFKYNLTDLQGAIGVEQLRKADRLWEGRRRAARLYNELLEPWAEFVQTPFERPDRQSSWHLYPLRLRLEALTIDRAEFIEQLKARGITCSVHWMPLHLHPYYRRTYGYQPHAFPVAEREWKRLISLPLFPSMSVAELEYVVTSIAEVALAHARHSVHSFAGLPAPALAGD